MNQQHLGIAMSGVGRMKLIRTTCLTVRCAQRMHWVLGENHCIFTSSVFFALVCAEDSLDPLSPQNMSDVS